MHDNNAESKGHRKAYTRHYGVRKVVVLLQCIIPTKCNKGDAFLYSNASRRKLHRRTKIRFTFLLMITSELHVV